MKKVLIVYPISFQTPLIKGVMENVSCSSLKIDAIDIEKYIYYREGKGIVISRFFNWLFCCDIKDKSIQKSLFDKIIEVVHYLFDKRMLKKYMSCYEVVDFHFFCKQQSPLITMASRAGKKIKINLWGSDLLRITQKDKVYQIKGYELADVIQMATAPMYNKFCIEYPRFKAKTRIALFGNSVLSDNLNYLKEPINISFLNHYDENKIVITCGYNGSEGQQHSKIIEQINCLPEVIRRKIYLILPMTYGSNSAYLHEILGQLSNNCYSYDVIEQHLTGKELCDLRRVTDIVVNIQITDAFSGSLQEHLQCGNILILGDWLPYDILKDNNVFFLSSSIKGLSSCLTEVINNLECYKDKCRDNANLIFNISSWKIVAPKWREIYNSI